MALNGFALGASLAAAPNLIIEVVPPDRTSEATGVVQIARKVAMATGSQIVAISLATSTVRSGTGAYPDESAYFLTYAWVAATCALAFALTFALPRGVAHRPAPPEPMDATLEPTAAPSL
jgi:MFS family permease